MSTPRQARLWPGVVLAIMLALFAFVLSFDALRVVGLACGIQPSLAWMFPLIVDGSTLAFTWAAWAFKSRRMGTVYPWMMLVVFSLISLVGNALHAHPVLSNGLLLPAWAASAIMTVPPVALLATTHMIVLAAARSLDDPPVGANPMDSPQPTGNPVEPVAGPVTRPMEQTVEPVGNPVEQNVKPSGNFVEQPAGPVGNPEGAVTKPVAPPRPAASPMDSPQPTEGPVDPPRVTEPIGLDTAPAAAPAVDPMASDAVAGRQSSTLEDAWSAALADDNPVFDVIGRTK